MTRDADFLLSVLEAQPGEWVAQTEILRRSEQARGCGMTVHSRAADLRARGLTVENRTERRAGRVVSFYRLARKGERGVLAASVAKSSVTSTGRPPSELVRSQLEPPSSLFEIPASARPAWA